METYLLVNIFFLCFVVLLLRITRVSKAQLVTLTVLLALTAVFDAVIVGLGIVAYDPLLILGIRIFGAPIEDFFYAIMAALAVPALWHILGKYYDKRA